jgi:hypothetical protein
VWTGFRPGFDHAMVYPLKAMRGWGEPIWPYDVTLSQNVTGRASARAWLGRLLTKAGLTPRTRVTLDGAPALHVETLLRLDANGNGLLLLINHEDRPGDYTVASADLARVEQVAEVRAGTDLPVREGAVQVALGGGKVAILALGTADFVAERRAAHAAIRQEVAPMPERFAGP